MKISKSLASLLPAAALFAFAGAPVAYAYEIPSSILAADLPAGSVATGLEAAGVQAEPGGFVSYVERLRQWGSAGFRVQAGHIQLFSMQREQPGLSAGNVEVAGVQIGDVNADATISYAEGLRLFTSQGFRVQPGHVGTSALIRS
jgi:hypothetical protein